MLKVDRPVDGLYAETAGDHVAWCVEGSNAALTAPEIVNSIHMWSDVFVVNGSADGSLMKERARSCLIQISVPAASPLAVHVKKGTRPSSKSALDYTVTTDSPGAQRRRPTRRQTGRRRAAR